MRGRPPDPNRADRGTGHRPLPDVQSAILPGAKVPDADHLPAPVRAVYAEVVEAYAPLGEGVLSSADRYTLEALATLVHQLRELQASVDTDGTVLYDERTGEPKVNPAVNAAQRVAASIARLAEGFGGSPAARIRLGLAIAQRESLVQTLQRMAQED